MSDPEFELRFTSDGNRELVDATANGGALPDPITTDVTISPAASAVSPLTVAPTGDGGDLDSVFTVVGPANLHGGTGEGYYLELRDADGTSILNIDPSGFLQVKPNQTEGDASPAALLLYNKDGTDPTVIYGGDLGYDRISVQAGGARLFRVGPLGEISTKASQPADNTIIAGEVVLWFDSTNGAAKLKIKGKTLDGTVVHGEVALT